MTSGSSLHKGPSHKRDGGDLVQTATDVETGVLEKPQYEARADYDPALDFTGGEDVAFTAEEERNVVRKIDKALMALLCWIYALQFADKTSLNYASLMGIREDTNLNPNSQEFSWASSIFYAGYIAWE